MDDIRFNFLDSPTRTLTEQQFLRGGTTSETWQDAIFRDQGNKLDSLEKLARSFGSFGNAKLSTVEKAILVAGDDGFSLDQRTEISSERRSENVPVTEFMKAFTNSPSSSSGSSFSLTKSANRREVARVEKDVLDDGTISTSEYGEDGGLLRAWISVDGKPPAQMQKTIVPDGVHGVHGPALLHSIFERRDTA